MFLKEQPRILKTKLSEVERWLSNNFYRKDRDYSYSLQGPYVIFEFKRFAAEQAFHRQFTRYYR